MAREYETHRPDQSVKEHVAFWRKRALETGKRGVVHCAHSDKEAVTEQAVLRNHFGQAFAGLKKRGRLPTKPWVLDFGCGWGRWTPFLADATGGHVTGLDISSDYIMEARKLAVGNPFVKFENLIDPMSKFPFGGSSFDLIFTCTVLQHLVRSDLLYHTLDEFRRVLTPKGLLVMFEATAKQHSKPHIVFGGVDRYQRLLPWMKIRGGWTTSIRGEEHTLMLGERDAVHF